MRVGVYPVTNPHAGGTYQYSLSVLQAMDQLRADFEPVITFDRRDAEAVTCWIRSGWEAIPFGPRSFRSIARSLVVRTVGESGAMRLGRRFLAMRLRFSSPQRIAPPAPNDLRRDRNARWLRARGVDLMLYPLPTTRSFQIGVPYVMAIHDLQHRIHPEFPEVSADGEYEAREYLFANGVRYAEAILVDSDIGREDVLRFYGDLIAPERVHVLPFVTPPYLKRPDTNQLTRVVATLGLPDRYLLFPAQFWPHKNHLRVAEALGALHRSGLDVTVVMTGSGADGIRARVMRDLKSIIADEGVEGLVRFVGYVEDDVMASLYASAWGVILPTYFGPTNIPVIEAWSMRVPVLTSDIRGIREQCGDAAILVDPGDTGAIADGIRGLWSDTVLRGTLVAAGENRLAGSDSDAFRLGLKRILIEVGARRPNPVAIGPST